MIKKKQAERDLADKEVQLRVALDNMPGALVYTDKDLNVVFCNNRLLVTTRNRDYLPRFLKWPLCSWRVRRIWPEGWVESGDHSVQGYLRCAQGLRRHGRDQLRVALRALPG